MTQINNSLPSLTVTKIPHLNTIVLRQQNGHFFVATKDSFVIDVYGLSFIIKFLIMNNIISHRILEGILDEYYSSRDS
jgi:hypothetical protein